MMNWTSEEKENLLKLLLSVDESNRNLAFEILNTIYNIDEFAPVLYLIYNVDYEIIAHENILRLFGKISAEKNKEWTEKSELIKSIYRFSKIELKDLLENYEKEAMQIFETYLAMAPQHAHVYNTIGNRFIRMGMKTKGLSFLKKAAEFNPQSYTNNFDYAFNTSESKKNAAIVIKHYKKCIELEDRGIAPYHNMGRLYAHQMGDYFKAIEILKEGLLKYPKSTDTMIELASSLGHSGNIKDERSYLEQAIENDSYCHLAHNNFAFLLWSKFKEYDKAKTHILNALNIKPKDGLYWHTLAEVEWYGFKNREKALEALYKGKSVQKSYKGGDQMIAELENINAHK